MMMRYLDQTGHNNIFRTMQDANADAEKRRAEAAAERERATTERARAEVDAAELEEQLRAHQATQVRTVMKRLFRQHQRPP
jgi:hypothetical protein